MGIWKNWRVSSFIQEQVVSEAHKSGITKSLRPHDFLHICSMYKPYSYAYSGNVSLADSVSNPRKTTSNFLLAGLLTFSSFVRLPFSVRKSGIGVAQSYIGDYSSGSVQDLHLIPFSSFVRSLRTHDTNNLLQRWSISYSSQSVL